MNLVTNVALRNLSRHRLRTALAVGGIGIATMMLIWNLAFINGFFDMMIRGATDVEIGHVQVQHRDYVQRPSTLDYMAWDDEVRATVSETEGVRGHAPRVRLFGLVGHEERSVVGRIFGVDPVLEPQVTVIDEGLVEGRWLEEAREPGGVVETVVGSGLARSLGVGLGDELVIIVEGADGSMGDALLEIVGIAQTGNSAIDRTAVLIALDEAQYIAAMEGAVHEVVIAVARPAEAQEVASRLQERLNAIDRGELQARPWQQVAAGLYELLAVSNQSNYVIFLVIFIIVGLGVLNVLRMSARERMREFGVMLAVGMSRKRLFTMIMLEGFVVGVLGALVGAVAGGLLSWYHSTYGLDFGAFIEGDATYMGVSFSDRMYLVTSLDTVLVPAAGLVVVTLICALWPAIASVRLNPRDAITGRQT